MKYFIEYNLGWKGPGNLKAEKGTVVHKVLEILADIKLRIQKGEEGFTDDIVGEIKVDNYDLDIIIEKCTDYYRKYSGNAWRPADYKECSKWVYKAIEYNGGEFDPRNSNIVKAEQAFDILIEKDWAKYEYDMPDGTKIEGYLAIKGTIDQVSQVSDDTYMILDWKTGRRFNWAKGTEKDYAALNKDPQLMMYFYAAQHIYPDIDYIDICIYFINDGGPYTICFSKEDMPRIEDMLRRKFLDIKETEIPALSKSWKCSKLCHFGKTTFERTHVPTIVERRSGQVTPMGKCMTKCEQVKYCLENRPKLSVIKNMSAEGHSIDHYHAPGTVE